MRLSDLKQTRRLSRPFRSFYGVQTSLDYRIKTGGENHPVSLTCTDDPLLFNDARPRLMARSRVGPRKSV